MVVWRLWYLLCMVYKTCVYLCKRQTQQRISAVMYYALWHLCSIEKMSTLLNQPHRTIYYDLLASSLAHVLENSLKSLGFRSISLPFSLLTLRFPFPPDKILIYYYLFGHFWISAIQFIGNGLKEWQTQMQNISNFQSRQEKKVTNVKRLNICKKRNAKRKSNWNAMRSCAQNGTLQEKNATIANMYRYFFIHSFPP